jgi:hypothetical protein
MAKKTEKKPEAKAPDAVKTAKPPKAKARKPKEQKPQLLSLSQDELLKLRLHESETVRWASEAHLRQGKRNEFLRKVDPQGLLSKMDEEIRAVAQKSQQCRMAYQQVAASVEKRLNIKLAEYSFDDETGVLLHAGK